MPVRLRNGKKGFTLTELAFVGAIIAIFIILLTPFITNIRSKAKNIACEENLQKIALGLKLYASEHEEGFPRDLKELLEGGYVEGEKVFNCPSSPHAGCIEEPDYHYVTGYTISSPSGSALVFDKDKNHRGGKYVLSISGDIVWKKYGAMAE